MKFTIYPAIDLRAGRVVRLVQGDPSRQTIYGDDPALVAKRWLQAGAAWLHVVNLDGAFGEAGQENQAALKAILKTAAETNPEAQVQFGGGLRSHEDVESALSVGVSRVMLGTMAIEAPEDTAQVLEHHGPQKIGLAVDAREGKLRVRGWTQDAGVDPVELSLRLSDLGLRTCAYTDIRRDGGGQGINLNATTEFAEATGLSVIASGGAKKLEDVKSVRDAGLSGIIIGRALYEGDIDLQEALQC